MSNARGRPPRGATTMTGELIGSPRRHDDNDNVIRIIRLHRRTGHHAHSLRSHVRRTPDRPTDLSRSSSPLSPQRNASSFTHVFIYMFFAPTAVIHHKSPAR
eukprot:GHVU01178138.1.p2 GENE.GHVU01178138.1~~GHVU01178138.1.p2  ORF type:complete len:102 (+),score=5.07 GHVU01178138.1:359-664(+)